MSLREKFVVEAFKVAEKLAGQSVKVAGNALLHDGAPLVRWGTQGVEILANDSVLKVVTRGGLQYAEQGGKVIGTISDEAVEEVLKKGAVVVSENAGKTTVRHGATVIDDATINAAKAPTAAPLPNANAAAAASTTAAETAIKASRPLTDVTARKVFLNEKLEPLDKIRMLSEGGADARPYLDNMIDKVRRGGIEIDGTKLSSLDPALVKKLQDAAHESAKSGMGARVANGFSSTIDDLKLSGQYSLSHPFRTAASGLWNTATIPFKLAGWAWAHPKLTAAGLIGGAIYDGGATGGENVRGAVSNVAWGVETAADVVGFVAPPVGDALKASVPVIVDVLANAGKYGTAALVAGVDQAGKEAGIDETTAGKVLDTIETTLYAASPPSVKAMATGAGLVTQEDEQSAPQISSKTAFNTVKDKVVDTAQAVEEKVNTVVDLNTQITKSMATLASFFTTIGTMFNLDLFKRIGQSIANFKLDSQNGDLVSQRSSDYQSPRPAPKPETTPFMGGLTPSMS